MEWEEKLSQLFRIVMVANTLNLVAIKISIILEINVNSSCSTDRGEDTSDFKILSEFYK